MSLILPIMVMAVILGLCVKRITPPVWLGMAVWTAAIVVHYLIKN